MPIFRVNKPNNFTIVANSIIYNPRLSYKAKCLLIAMLGKPDDWDFTAVGLTKYSMDGIASVNSGLKELEREGYLVRIRTRNCKGRFDDVVYEVYEFPAPPEPRSPEVENPFVDSPFVDIPQAEEPQSENPPLLNTILPNTETTKTVLPITPSIPDYRRYVDDRWDGRIDLDTMRQEIREQIDYELIATPSNREKLNELVELMLEIAIHRAPTYRFSRNYEQPTELVQERFRQLTADHIQMVLDSLADNTTKIRNPKAYLLTALFNAPATIGNHYAMMVNHDMYGGDTS